jgi:preprotein translocase subunit SecA
MNKQRNFIYRMRRDLLEGRDMRKRVMEMVEAIIGSLMTTYCSANDKPHNWDFDALQTDALSQFGVKIAPAVFNDLSRPEIEETIRQKLVKRYEEKEQQIPPEVLRETERIVMLNVIDNQWKDHLLQMDHLKEGIGLRGYGQKDPLVEYKKESFKLFEAMRDRIEDEIIRILYFLQASEQALPVMAAAGLPGEDEDAELVAAATRAQRRAAESSITNFTQGIQRRKQKELDGLQFAGGGATTAEPVVRGKKIGRNAPCPCGSGKKYKKCCGK